MTDKINIPKQQIHAVSMEPAAFHAETDANPAKAGMHNDQWPEEKILRQIIESLTCSAEFNSSAHDLSRFFFDGQDAW